MPFQSQDLSTTQLLVNPAPKAKIVNDHRRKNLSIEQLTIDKLNEIKVDDHHHSAIFESTDLIERNIEYLQQLLVAYSSAQNENCQTLILHILNQIEAYLINFATHHNATYGREFCRDTDWGYFAFEFSDPNYYGVYNNIFSLIVNLANWSASSYPRLAPKLKDLLSNHIYKNSEVQAFFRLEAVQRALEHDSMHDFALAGIEFLAHNGFNVLRPQRKLEYLKLLLEHFETSSAHNDIITTILEKFCATTPNKLRYNYVHDLEKTNSQQLVLKKVLQSIDPRTDTSLETEDLYYFNKLLAKYNLPQCPVSQPQIFQHLDFNTGLAELSQDLLTAIDAKDSYRIIRLLEQNTDLRNFHNVVTIANAGGCKIVPLGLPIVRAMATNNQTIIEAIGINYAALVNTQTLLQVAVKIPVNPEILEFLLSKCPEQINKNSDFEEMVPLQIIAEDIYQQPELKYECKLTLIRVLLRHGADISLLEPARGPLSQPICSKFILEKMALDLKEEFPTQAQMLQEKIAQLPEPNDFELYDRRCCYDVFRTLYFVGHRTDLFQTHLAARIQNLPERKKRIEALATQEESAFDLIIVAGIYLELLAMGQQILADQIVRQIISSTFLQPAAKMHFLDKVLQHKKATPEFTAAVIIPILQSFDPQNSQPSRYKGMDFNQTNSMVLAVKIYKHHISSKQAQEFVIRALAVMPLSEQVYLIKQLYTALQHDATLAPAVYMILQNIGLEALSKPFNESDQTNSIPLEKRIFLVPLLLNANAKEYLNFDPLEAVCAILNATHSRLNGERTRSWSDAITPIVLVLNYFLIPGFPKIAEKFIAILQPIMQQAANMDKNDGDNPLISATSDFRFADRDNKPILHLNFLQDAIIHFTTVGGIKHVPTGLYRRLYFQDVLILCLNRLRPEQAQQLVQNIIETDNSHITLDAVEILSRWANKYRPAIQSLLDSIVKEKLCGRQHEGFDSYQRRYAAVELANNKPLLS